MIKVFITICLIVIAIYVLYSTESFANDIHNTKPINIGPFLFNDVNKKGKFNVSNMFSNVENAENGKLQRLYVYNPSIAYDNNGNIVGVSRLTGKIAKECSYYDENDYVEDKEVNLELSQYNKKYHQNLSTVIFWSLNKLPQFTIVPMFSADKICDNSDFLETSQGVEDPRIFNFQNKLWIYGHYRGFLGECTHSPVIIPALPPYNVNNMLKLYTDNMRYIEKNWMPFEYNSELYFLYDISPHIILKCDFRTGYCREVYRTNNAEYDRTVQKHVGGGAPPIKIKLRGKTYFLALAHTREDKPVITRKNFFYVFRASPPFDIIMMGDVFNIMKEYRAIEFGSGMLLSKDGESVILSAGISDCYSVITQMPLSSILNNMRHVGVL
jgi:hypothetical protein